MGVAEDVACAFGGFLIHLLERGFALGEGGFENVLEGGDPIALSGLGFGGSGGFFVEAEPVEDFGRAVVDVAHAVGASLGASTLLRRAWLRWS